MVEEKKEQEKSKDNYELKEVITGTDTGIGLVGSEEVFTDKGLLLVVLNTLNRIETKLGNM